LPGPWRCVHNPGIKQVFGINERLLEQAAACGLPVIVRNNYEAETVVHRETGFQAGSDEDLMSSLELLLGNGELRRKLGRAGRLHSRRFDWDVITEQWQEIFERAAGNREWRKAS
jgi:glycosyltransferase involved in cell wall biosynthesis